MLFLTEKDVLDTFAMETALDAVRASFLAQTNATAVNRPRRRILLRSVSLHYMAGALAGEELLGMKVYTVSSGLLRFVVLLYDASSGELLALIEADHLGRIRTGAASGVATQVLSRPDSSTLGMLGAGRQARTQLHAISLVRPLRLVRVYSQDEQRRKAFCDEMSQVLHLDVASAGSAEAAVRAADILVTATSAHDPVLFGGWVSPGVHINAVGANSASRRELDDSALDRASVIAVDSLEQCKIEAGDLIQAFRNSPGRWESVVEMKDMVAGGQPGRKSPDEITLFKSTGIAIWDIAAAGAVYRRALELGLGKQIELSKS
jgi:alanine dehydrogenase